MHSDQPGALARKCSSGFCMPAGEQKKEKRKKTRHFSVACAHRGGGGEEGGCLACWRDASTGDDSGQPAVTTRDARPSTSPQMCSAQCGAIGASSRACTCKARRHKCLCLRDGPHPCD